MSSAANVLPVHTADPSTSPSANYLRNLLLAPELVFGSLPNQPRWVFPILASGAIALVENYLIVRRLGLQNLLASIIGAKGSVDPNALMQAAVQHQQSIIASEALSSVFGPFGTVLMASCGLWLLFTSFFGAVRFRFIFSVLAHVTLYLGLLRFLILIPVVYGIDPQRFNIMNPIGTNLAYYLHTNLASVNVLLAHLDLLTALGLGTAIWALKMGTPRISSYTWVASVILGAFSAYLGILCLFA